MTITYRWLTPDIATAGQLSPDDVTQAAKDGFRSVVNNRPDYEAGPAQPTSEAIARAATAAGVAYAFLPVQSRFQTPQEAARMRELLDTLPKPLLAFCRSGARSGNLVRMAAALPSR